jgi:hypothetical protein
MANIIDKIAQIRAAVFGKDIRESMASGIESINAEVVSTTSKQQALETTFDGLIINAGNSNAEIVDARLGEVTLKSKLQKVDVQLAANSQQLKDIGINIRQFGGHTADEVGFENFDNHDAILNALHSLDSVGGGNLILPLGIINTTPFDPTGCKNVVIIGNGSNPSNQLFQDDINTTIKFINTVVAPLGIKSADSINPYLTTPTYLVHSITLKNLILDGNHKVTHATNGNYNIAMENVIVKNCLSHGIVLEDYSYPVHFKHVLSYFNGGHGIHIRGNMSTCMDFDGCEFNFNEGYGCVVEGGAGVTFKDCKYQGNVQGGKKFNWVGLGVVNYFLNNIIDINPYYELNGTLAVGALNYEGNYAIVITGNGEVGNVQHKPTDIQFIGGAINASPTGRALKINCVSGCTISSTVRADMVDIANADVYGLEFTSRSTIGSDIIVGAGRAFTSYHRNTGCIGKHFNGGLFPKRGRTKELYFYVTAGDLVAGGSCLARTGLVLPAIATTLGASGYPVMKNGCVYGMQVRKVSKTNSSGIISVYPVFANNSGYATVPSTGFPLGVLTGKSAIMDMNVYSVDNQNIDYDIDDFPITSNQVIGVKLVAPANYIKGDHDGYIITLLIEF